MDKFFTTKTLLLVLGLFFLLSIVVLNPLWQIKGDGHGYYVYLRSLYFDHNLDFTNEYLRYDNLYGTELLTKALTPIGKLGNPFAVGLPIFLIPFFLLARLLEFFSGFNSTDLAGFNVIYQLTIGFSALVFVLVGAGFLQAGLKKFFSNLISWWGTVGVILLSPLILYVIYEPGMSHALSFAIGSILFWYSSCLLKADQINNKQLLLLGVFMGLAILVRWQEIFTWFVPMIVLFIKQRQGKIFIKQLILPFITASICFLPQLVLWYYLYGQWLTIPQGSSFMQWTQFKFFGVLFSGYHGLFIWHLFLLLGLFGLLISYKYNKIMFLALGLVLLGQIYVNASTSDWVGGSAFGARKMIGSLFVFAYGLAYLIYRSQIKVWLYRVLILLIIVGAGWNWLLMVSTARGYLPLGEPTTVSQVFSAPFKVILSK